MGLNLSRSLCEEGAQRCMKHQQEIQKIRKSKSLRQCLKIIVIVPFSEKESISFCSSYEI